VAGIEAAAVTTGLPLSGWGDGMPVPYAGQKRRTAWDPDSRSSRRSIFQALGSIYWRGACSTTATLRARRPWWSFKRGPSVKRYFPSASAIGKRILVERSSGVKTRPGAGSLLGNRGRSSPTRRAMAWESPSDWEPMRASLRIRSSGLGEVLSGGRGDTGGAHQVGVERAVAWTREQEYRRFSTL